MANDRNKKNRSIQASTNVFLTSFSGGRQRQLTTWLNSVFVFENSGIWRDRSKSMTHYTDCEKMSPKSRIFSKSAKSSHSNFWADLLSFLYAAIQIFEFSRQKLVTLQLEIIESISGVKIHTLRDVHLQPQNLVIRSVR